MSRREDKLSLTGGNLAGSTANNTHLPLLKVMQKLGLIDEEHVAMGLPLADSLPVAYYANCGMYNERKAVEKISNSIHLPLHWITPDVVDQARRLMSAPPCSQVPFALWMKLRALPFETTEDYVKVVLANPLDLDGIKALEFKLQNPVRAYIGIESDIVSALKGCDTSALDTSAFVAGTDTLEIRTTGRDGGEFNLKILGDGSLNPPATNKPIGKRRVLLVDDDEDVRAVLTALLEHSLFEVIQAKDGRDALKAVYDAKPEIVVCDLMMPGMDGKEFVQALRNDTRIKHIPVIMLTAASTEENELELIKTGADDFVSKTAKSDILLARVTRLLSRAAD